MKKIKVKKTKKFFWRDASGVNADLQRHMDEEKKLSETISNIEKEEESQSKEFRLRVYRNCLRQLLNSKAEVVSKVGTKKS